PVRADDVRQAREFPQADAERLRALLLGLQGRESFPGVLVPAAVLPRTRVVLSDNDRLAGQASQVPKVEPANAAVSPVGIVVGGDDVDVRAGGAGDEGPVPGDVAVAEDQVV